MDGKVVSLSSLQYERAHADARSRCTSLQAFLAGFDVATNHVMERADVETGDHQAVRRCMSNKDIAAVILQGRLDYGRCETKVGFRKIAIEALFTELLVHEGNGVTRILENVQVRVVVKDLNSGGKMIVVTYYKLYPEEEKQDLNEVDYENVWE